MKVEEERVEEWCKVAGFDGYEVSSKGRVRSFFEQVSFGKWEVSDIPRRELSLSEDTAGYLRVGLRCDGRTHSFQVHRLVAEAFIGPRPRGCGVGHKDNDKQNNVVGNLGYVTCKENANNGYGAGSSRLTSEEAELIRDLAADGWSDKKLAERFDVSQEVVRCCRLHHAYKWAGGPITKRRPGCHNRVQPTNEEVRQMRVLAHDGVRPLSDIASRYDVSLSYLSKVIRGQFRREAGGPISDPRSKHFEERMKI